MKAEDIKKKLKRSKEKTLTDKDFLSTGSTMLNLACTDYPDKGFAKGRYYLLVGTSSSGKTFLSLTCLAEAARNPNFNSYLFIYNDVERGAMMDIEKFFGKKVAQRLKVKHSYTIEDFYYHLDRMLKREIPFIYILDSMDALTSEFELAKFQKKRKAHEEEKETAGSYGDGKAKVNSQNLRQAINQLEKTGSILIIINQTRDKLVGFGGGKTRSGGHAMQFYACLEIWSDVKGRIKKTYKKKEREQGKLCTLRVRKNRVKGKDRTIQVPIYHSYGIDDVGSCVDYIISEGHWKKKKGSVKAHEFDFEGNRNQLIDYITKEGMERDLAEIAAEVWKDIEEAVAIKRKPRYV
ncbi:hypothetical protein AC477_02835 [miscellaneous Crenarchaeota group-1 archaeon SG8-32-1]|uniref:RecA family profile 2 domain-containing protein n=1 Tax=miscellaneous Crenarchaeota group-1 archaeon SG8-32-1 TaxID=1685124 RepID=A0A0M0BWJ4_9ARCH|nr:MAG: hypothetical protein AC477_02835 [miscellaneous Crenarchaeota group-1 archaeon SG8-32-1]